MPLFGSYRARSLCVASLCAIGLSLCCANSRSAVAAWPWSDPAAENVGSAQWWKKNKKNAVFEPGKGYTVEGQEGYFDGFGRPVSSPVAPENVVTAGDPSEEVGLIPGLDPAKQYNKMKAAVGLGPNEQLRKAYTEGFTAFNEKTISSATAVSKA